MRTFAIAIRKQNDCRHKIGIWCNGNTTDSGPVIPGSNPGSPTNHQLFTDKNPLKCNFSGFFVHLTNAIRKKVDANSVVN